MRALVLIICDLIPLEQWESTKGLQAVDPKQAITIQAIAIVIIAKVWFQTQQLLSPFCNCSSCVESEPISKDWLNPPSTVRAVICYISRGNEYLLLLKSKGKFGEGFWNAPGGKIEHSETSEQAAKREVLEETGLAVRELSDAGFLEFYFGQGKKAPDWTAQVFHTSTFSGDLKARSEEGELRWFRKEDLPYEQMWEDDRHWLPLLVSGIRFKGVFEFTSDSKKIVSYKVTML